MPVIAVHELAKQFGPSYAVRAVSFEVKEGEVFGFLGPNGAGKSTTIRLLLGLYRPTAGRMRVFDLDPTRDAVALHRRVGYLPGELALYPRLTGREHLDRFASARQLRELNFRDKLVERFDVELDRPVRTLSKGNRQKVGLVLAFMHRPDLLILDEPTSGLDPLLQEEFQTLIRETVAEGRTVLLCSHELDEVQRLADRVAIIKEGSLVVTDTVEALRRAAPRTVEFRFPANVGTQAFETLDGVQVVRRTDEWISVAVTGPLAPLLRVAADLNPLEMTARPADLDELFLTYYRTAASRADT